MAYSQADLDVLDQAIATSELEVEVAGRRVKFDSFEGLKKRRDYVADQLSAQSARGRTSYRFTMTTSRGD
jgi:hypothetical protein